MIGDLLSAIELLIKALGEARSPDAKRRQVAKTLSSVYLQLSTITARGNKIISRLQQSGDVDHRALRHLIYEQKKSITSVCDQIGNQHVWLLLDLHVPKSITAKYAMLGKLLLLEKMILDIGDESSTHQAHRRGLFKIFTTHKNGILKDRESESRYQEIREDLARDFDAKWLDEYDPKSLKAELRELEDFNRKLKKFLVEKFEFEDLL